MQEICKIDIYSYNYISMYTKYNYTYLCKSTMNIIMI